MEIKQRLGYSVTTKFVQKYAETDAVIFCEDMSIRDTLSLLLGWYVLYENFYRKNLC
jgi:hypothetical protein